MTDTTTMSGAQFKRHVGTDPEKWAEAFLAAYAKAEGLHTEADRLAFVMSWFRDAMRTVVGSEAVEHWRTDPAQPCPPTASPARHAVARSRVASAGRRTRWPRRC